MTGRKSKKQKQSRNISGLRNQPKASPVPSYNPTPAQSSAPSPGGDGYDDDDDDADLELLLHFDSMKVSLQHEGEHIDVGDDEDDGALEEWPGFHSPDVSDAMGAMIHKVIYPGSNGDPWWDTDQLLVQVKSALEIFEAAHPDCQALFIFDQSSAHASLPPDALKAFTMNKSNGGAQRKQKNTVIPQSNPDPKFHGVHQEMITPEGEAKGLKDCLEECGFDVSRVKAKTAAWLGCCHSKKTS
jgi:hypothetical protein